MANKHFNLSDRSGLPALWLLLLIIMEVGFLTFLRGKAGAYLSPVLLCCISLAIPLYIHYLAQKEAVFLPDFNKKEISKTKIASWSVFILSLCWFLLKFSGIIKNYPIDAAISDIIPAIDIYTGRFLSGETVYTTFPVINGYRIEPNYLPMQWLPFSFSKLLHFDHRYMAAFVLVAGLFTSYYYLVRRENNDLLLLIKTVLPFFILYEFMRHEPNMFGQTIEVMIAGYYLILFTGIVSRSPLFIATGIVLCLLSRYSLVFWLPLYFMLIYLKHSRKAAILTAGLVCAGVLVIYIIPFLAPDWMSFKRGYEYYLNGTLGEWFPHGWQQPGDKPFHLCRGVGAACFFYDFAPGDNLQRMAVSRSVNVFVSAVAVLLATVFIFKRKRLKDYRLYSLLSLKFYFAIFYTFIHVPYVYLHLVPVMLSVFLFLSLKFKESSRLG